MLEIEKLANMLKEAGIPFERNSEDLRPNYNYYKFQIIYPRSNCGINENHAEYAALFKAHVLTVG